VVGGCLLGVGQALGAAPLRRAVHGHWFLAASLGTGFEDELVFFQATSRSLQANMVMYSIGLPNIARLTLAGRGDTGAGAMSG
jgi:hypothetical protein